LAFAERGIRPLLHREGDLQSPRSEGTDPADELTPGRLTRAVNGSARRSPRSPRTRLHSRKRTSPGLTDRRDRASGRDRGRGRGLESGAAQRQRAPRGAHAGHRRCPRARTARSRQACAGGSSRTPYPADSQAPRRSRPDLVPRMMFRGIEGVRLVRMRVNKLNSACRCAQRGNIR
jgi:hypothetical protein